MYFAAYAPASRRPRQLTWDMQRLTMTGERALRRFTSAAAGVLARPARMEEMMKIATSTPTISQAVARGLPRAPLTQAGPAERGAEQVMIHHFNRLRTAPSLTPRALLGRSVIRAWRATEFFYIETNAAQASIVLYNALQHFGNTLLLPGVQAMPGKTVSPDRMEIVFMTGLAVIITLRYLALPLLPGAARLPKAILSEVGSAITRAPLASMGGTCRLPTRAMSLPTHFAAPKWAIRGHDASPQPPRCCDGLAAFVRPRRPAAVVVVAGLSV